MNVYLFLLSLLNKEDAYYYYDDIILNSNGEVFLELPFYDDSTRVEPLSIMLGRLVWNSPIIE